MDIPANAPRIARGVIVEEKANTVSITGDWDSAIKVFTDAVAKLANGEQFNVAITRHPDHTVTLRVRLLA